MKYVGGHIFFPHQGKGCRVNSAILLDRREYTRTHTYTDTHQCCSKPPGAGKPELTSVLDREYHTPEPQNHHNEHQNPPPMHLLPVLCISSRLDDAILFVDTAGAHLFI